MIKESWGTKQTCPKCGARFYDLGKDSPVVCIECENSWVPEPVLKSKQAIPIPVKKAEKPVEKKEPKPADADSEDGDGEKSEEDILAAEGLDIEIEDGDDDEVVDNLSLDDDNPDVSDVIDSSAVKANKD